MASVTGAADGGAVRRLSTALYRHRGGRLLLTLGPPLVWMVVVYLGSLGLLLAFSFWRLDVFTSEIVHDWGLTSFRTLWEGEVYRTIAVRTVGIAAAVTVTDIVLAFPLAYHAARIATPRMRNALLIAVVLPLWANYLVRVFAWRIILTPNGFLNWLAGSVGLGSLQLGRSNWAVWLTSVYLWLPFTLLPIYSALERIPESFLEASSDLGARGWFTFRRVVFPLILPGIVAGSIFSFSLTLGDYIVPELVGNTQFIGNVIYDNVGVAGNIPLAAAFALVPIVVMAVYLLLAKRAGAFESL
ncbi:MAG TPA: ABC transporter permease [Actinomycetota bacterium]|nr:ABC transporter permease [Actinomycetota bacterium]